MKRVISNIISIVITSDLLQWNYKKAGEDGGITPEMVKVVTYTYRGFRCGFRCGLKDNIALVET